MKTEMVLGLYLSCQVTFKGEPWKLKSVEIGVNGNVCGRLTRKRPDRETWDIETYEFRKGEIPIQLILTPLSEITDEDAIGVAKIVMKYPSTLTDSDYWNWGRCFAFNMLENKTVDRFETGWGLSQMDIVNIADYLRSKGYHLPFMGQDLYEAGIAITPTTSNLK